MVLLAALLAAGTAQVARAHAGLTGADPAPGAALGASPTAIKLTFSERPGASLSRISVVDRRGTSFQTGPPELSPDDPLSLVVPVRVLPKGVYTVSWRVDSAIDGHATTGVFSFGVQVPASEVSGIPRSTTAAVSSPLELLARWLLLTGLVLVLGAAAASVARFGDGGRGELLQAAAGWLVALAGLLLLAEAQRRNANSSLAALMRSSVGHALIWRAVGLAGVGAALLLAARATRVRRAAFLIAGVAALATVVVHVANGHAAAAGSWPSAVTVIAQSAHFALAGVWIGGLVALLIGLRGARSHARAQALRRFALVAAAGLAVVVTTGVLRAFSALNAWDELWSTGYGRAVLAKLAIVALIGGLALHNRRRGLSSAIAGDSAPLRRTSRAELGLAVCAIAVAALLGTLAPPVAGETGLRGLSASGSDVGNTVHASLSTLSNEPGPNRFVARIADSRSGQPVRGAAVRLLFTPLDDPGVASSSLALLPAGEGTYSASGANLTFDGRWAVRVLISRRAGAVEVPLELDPIGPPQQISVQRIPGQPPQYTKLTDAGEITISPRPERAGTSQLFAGCYDASGLAGQLQIRTMVVTLAAGNGPTRQEVLRRVGRGSFISNVRLASGRNEIAVTARTTGGARLRSVFDLNVPGG